MATDVHNELFFVKPTVYMHFKMSSRFIKHSRGLQIVRKAEYHIGFVLHVLPAICIHGNSAMKKMKKKNQNQNQKSKMHDRVRFKRQMCGAKQTGRTMSN